MLNSDRKNCDDDYVCFVSKKLYFYCSLRLSKVFLVEENINLFFYSPLFELS